MRINSATVKAAEAYVTEYLSVHLDKAFTFHDIEHTISVVKAVEMICNETGVNKNKKKLLLVAAWFHDLGYTERIEEHEDIGAQLAEKFLKECLVTENDIETVKNCIIATHYPQHPLTELEMILCDADMIHLAEKNYFNRVAVLRTEWADTRSKLYTDTEWLETNIRFLTSHSYHTEYCKKTLETRKEKNIKKLMTLQEQNNTVDITRQNEIVIREKKEKRTRPYEFGRGVETLFKIASGNHMRLSGMADNKAHILLSINSIIISIVLSVLAKKLGEATYLVWPTLLLLLVCLVSIVFAVLTTRPKVAKKNTAIHRLNPREVNLLFFGNFHHMEEATYESGIRELMLDNSFLYKTLTKDIYFLGKVLAVKYRYLNVGYMVFMYGLILSVFAFGISFFCGQPA